jgi:hypothetical protein
VAEIPLINDAVVDTSDGLNFIFNNIGAIKVPPPLPNNPANTYKIINLLTKFKSTLHKYSLLQLRFQ